jgi:hypothetical protein
MSDQTQGPKRDQGAREARPVAYEAPTISVIGPLDKITLGSAGAHNDNLAKFKK